MERQNFRNKLKSLLMQRQAIEEKLQQTEELRKIEIKNGEYNGPASLLHFALFDEKYSLSAKIGKLHDKFNKAGFTVQQWYDDYNMYIDLFRMEVK